MTDTQPLLQVKNLTHHFKTNPPLVDLLLRRAPRFIKVLNGIDLHLERGETLGVVGESGCGKSTLARCLVGLYPPQGGEILFDNQNVSHKTRAEQRDYNRRVQMMFQDPYSSLNPRMTVGQVLHEALSVHKMRPEAEIPDRIDELLDLVSLPRDAAGKLPHEFSGGQRQRVAIARALSVEPEILIADELVSALDVSVQAQVVNLLLDLQDRLGLTILFVAHDLRLVRHVSHRVAVIYLGSIVEIGASDSVFSSPVHPYSRALLNAAPSIDPDHKTSIPPLSGELPSPMNIPPGCAFHGRCPHATEICRQEKPLLKKFEGHGEIACHHAATLA
ncbi:ATP-binding cassette domain-containing protein [Kiloniella laminariae]|uniref:Glutathione import ATP-binding protein GsiA n=1 Tax=Kiloniella laminariae TaxID=454162 RepID=A0ABT4LED9_9PROT|nr:oligopeptide/dipeptide ABC transporter ATP-binding protein [Kiloniella laminariae]MCZ4279463.1 ATP-binding cassette domain-containing protein [Kiloniella laminariae]